jgi:hypothetical protein
MNRIKKHNAPTTKTLSDFLYTPRSAFPKSDNEFYSPGGVSFSKGFKVFQPLDLPTSR